MKKIGILTPLGIGDIITLTPLLNKLKKVYPGSKVLLLTYNGGFLETMRINDVESIINYGKFNNLVPLFKEGLDILIGWGPLSQINSLIKKMAYLLFFNILPAKKKLIFLKKDMMNFPGMDISGIKLNILDKLGINITPEDYALKIPWEYSGNKEEILKLLSEDKKFSPSKKLLVAHIGSQKGYDAKLWPLARWNELFSYIQNNLPLNIAVIGTGRERELFSLLEPSAKEKIIDAIGKLPIQKTTALISLCDIFITTNSGPMWIAAALNKKGIALSGPSRKIWSPKGTSLNVIQKDISREHCAPPCNKGVCHYHDELCMSSITVDEVIKEIDAIYTEDLNQ